MRSTNLVLSLGAVAAVVAALVVSPGVVVRSSRRESGAATADCNLTQYKASTGLTSALEGNLLTVSWNGQGTSQLRARFAIDGGTPTIRDLSVRRGGGEWAMLGQNLTPEYQVTTGVRRMSNDQANAFSSLGIDVTPEVLEKHQVVRVLGCAAQHSRLLPRSRGAAGGGGSQARQAQRRRWDRAARLPSRSQPCNRGRAAGRATTRSRIRPASPAGAASVCRGRRKKSAAASPRSRRRRARSRATAPASR